jgi:hypothetical protein
MADVSGAPASAEEDIDAGASGFCAEVWERGAAMRDAITTMPFVKELADGSLAPAAFRHYLVQDSLYLREYSRALAIASSKATSATSQVRRGRLVFRPANDNNALNTLSDPPHSRKSVLGSSSVQTPDISHVGHMVMR